VLALGDLGENVEKGGKKEYKGGWGRSVVETYAFKNETISNTRDKGFGKRRGKVGYGRTRPGGNHT